MLMSGTQGERGRLSFGETPEQIRLLAVAVMHAAKVLPDAWTVGKTLIFMRPGVLAQLENLRGAILYQRVVEIQRRWRGLRARHAIRAFPSFCALRLAKLIKSVFP